MATGETSGKQRRQQRDSSTQAGPHCPRPNLGKINKNVITGQAKCNTNRIWLTSRSCSMAESLADSSRGSAFALQMGD